MVQKISIKICKTLVHKAYILLRSHFLFNKNIQGNTSKYSNASEPLRDSILRYLLWIGYLTRCYFGAACISSISIVTKILKYWLFYNHPFYIWCQRLQYTYNRNAHNMVCYKENSRFLWLWKPSPIWEMHLSFITS